MSYGILAGIKALLPQYAFAPEVVIRINLPVLLFSGAVAAGNRRLLLRTVAGAAVVADAGGPDRGSPNTRRVAGSVRGRRAAQCADRRTDCADAACCWPAAGSAMKGFLRLMHTPLGYDPHHVMSVGHSAARELVYHVGRARGVLRATASQGGGDARRDHGGDLQQRYAAAQWMVARGLRFWASRRWNNRWASINLIGPGYFAALRIPLLEGRIWNETENHNGAHLAVINRTLAQRYFPNGDAIGHSVKVPGLRRSSAGRFCPRRSIADSWLQIVGIVGDARNDGLATPFSRRSSCPTR